MARNFPNEFHTYGRSEEAELEFDSFVDDIQLKFLG
jgi:hypothetical protein